MTRLLRFVTIVLAIASVGPGCTAITSGDFEERAEPLVCGNDLAASRVDMRLDLTDMNAHLDNLTVANLVRIEGAGPARVRRIIARAVLDPLGEANLQIALPCTVLDGNHEVDLVADLNGNRMYDPCPRAPEGCEDHQWRLMLQADGTVSYQHDVDFVDLAQDAPLPRGALPVRAAFGNMSQFAGRRMEVHVRRPLEEGGFETVLVYVLGAVPDTNDMLVRREENLIELRERYEVAIWIDTNGNGIYDPPSSIGVDGRDYATTIDAVGEPPSAVDPGGVQVLFDGQSPPPQEDIALEL
ncbi:hypothetical protein [Sandaracinus amylolyticus]|uniref:hypothetical protein n=1 Tax=Sandaracinus amylolyticus TaxID=927083 RepID=UPI001F3234F1|nr:hypothetical protein [Sandaracinus amylolyticus]UJR84241.1 Hypothetical protein I5071_63180 [Sandaracinus amylolyticus]